MKFSKVTHTPVLLPDDTPEVEMALHEIGHDVEAVSCGKEKINIKKRFFDRYKTIARVDACMCEA